MQQQLRMIEPCLSLLLVCFFLFPSPLSFVFPSLSLTHRGIAINPNGIVWVAVNGNGTLNIYSLQGTLLRFVAVTGGGAPTGLVEYFGAKFLITKNRNTLPSMFITVTEAGTINAWNNVVDPLNAQITFSDASRVFKGCDIFEDMLYVTDFRGGFVDVFDSNWNMVYNFTDPSLTAIGYAPYNVKVVDDLLYVTFAQQDAAKHDAVIALGAGYVDIFEPNGTLVQRFANRDALNQPWGIESFSLSCNGTRSSVVLIGNFGDGRILVFSSSGTFFGFLADQFGNPFSIDGLWGIVNFNGTLWLAAGNNDEADGLVATLTEVA